MPRIDLLARALTLLAVIGLLVLPHSGALQAAQPLAPESLRCPGRALPEPPERWRWEWQWEVLDAYLIPGPGAEGPSAVALDRDCNLYIADGEYHRVVKISMEGDVLAQWTIPEGSPPQSHTPQGIAVDGQGNVYASDTPRDLVFKFSPQGQVIATLGSCATPSPENRFCDKTQPGMFNSPTGLTVDGAGNLYVVESANVRVQQIAPDGRPLAVWEMRGRVPGELFVLGQPALDLEGNLYVPDGFNNRLYKFSQDGSLVATFGGGPDPSGEPGRFHLPTGVAVDAGGNIYVSDVYNWRVQKLAADGTLIDHWRNCLDGPLCSIPGSGDGPGQFFGSRGLVVDGQGNLYVADTNNKRVQRLMAYPVFVPEPEIP
jgi:DNA-binding beta-propeller fold protein YncE